MSENVFHSEGLENTYFGKIQTVIKEAVGSRSVAVYYPGIGGVAVKNRLIRSGHLRTLTLMKFMA